MPEVSDAIISLEAPLRAGDVIWSQDRHLSLIVAVVDEDTGAVHVEKAANNTLAIGAPQEGTVDPTRITRQKKCTDAAHVAQLNRWARVGGNDPRGVIARRQLHRLWSDGKIGREPKT